MTPQAQARLQDAVFARLGENATWSGITDTVLVCRREYDEELQMGSARVIESGATIRVRKSDVPGPAEGDEVQLLDGDGNPLAEDGLFIISGTPKLDRKGVWRCQATPA